MNNGLTWDQENVNGVMLSLNCDIDSVSPKSRQFTISYSKNKEKKGSWALTSLLLAALFNIIALSYINISFTALIIIIIVFSFFVFFWITHSVQSESLLVVPSVGVQSTVKYVYGREDNFVPWCRLDDVVIDEVIKLNRVLYYLTLLVRTNIESNEDTKHLKLMPVFKYTKPRLPMLEMVYNEIKNLLTEVIKENSAKGSGDAASSVEPVKD